jgi:serine/threonine protein kinase
LLGSRSENGLGQVYLVDFGAVQNQVALGEGTFTVVGTYGYMPPEQFGGRSVPASDLYSLGATLIYLLTKVHPADLPQKNLLIQFEQVTQLSQDFKQWLRKMVEPSLDKRFSWAQFALQALKRPDLVNPLTGRKPEGSRVFFSKDTDTLQILLPPKEFCNASLLGNTIGTLFLMPFLMSSVPRESWAALPTIMPILDLHWPLIIVWGIIHTFAIIPVWDWFLSGVIAWGIIHLWATFFFDTFGKIRLRIDRDSISLSSEIFGLGFQKFPSSSRKNITKLEFISPHVMYEKRDSESPEQYKHMPPSILLRAGNQEYVLSSLTLPEQDWLANELSDWLGLPIEHRHLPIIK